MAVGKLVVSNPSKRDHLIRLMEGSDIEYPDLYMDVHIEGDISEQQAFAKMFAPSKCKSARSPMDADLVVFTGGVDVNPALYHAKPHPTTFFSDTRDRRDIDVWDMCVANGIPMLGICRGAQFGAVMKGAKLYQDVDNHNSDHEMWDKRTQKRIPVSSVHHQMVIEDKKGGMVVLGDSGAAKTRWIDPDNKRVGYSLDVEAFWYPDVAFLGIQGHPEYSGYDEFRLWTMKCIEDLIWSNPDIQLDKETNCRRLNKEHRDLSRIARMEQTWKDLN